jgi:hypothetical protein
MKKNGIKYEDGLPTSTNGSWQQTIAYLLDLLTKEEVTDEDKVNVSVIQSECLPPNQHIEVYNPHPLKNNTPKITIEKRTCPSPPKVSKMKKSDLYLRNCGKWNPTNSNYKRCMNCVDTHYTEVEKTKGYVSIMDMNIQKKCYCKK